MLPSGSDNDMEVIPMVRRLHCLVVLVVGALALMAVSASAGPKAPTLFGDHAAFVLFGGGDMDSTEQGSYWINVGAAKRVVIRTWSAKAAFHASTDADSTFSDSITTFRLVFSDSLASNSPFGAGDSILLDPAIANQDTAKIMVQAKGLPINKQLRGPGNGSGLITLVSGAPTGAITEEPFGFVPKKYMRVYVTPLRRNTVTGGQSTQGKRVNGLKGFRMWATVIR